MRVIWTKIQQIQVKLTDEDEDVELGRGCWDDHEDFLKNISKP